MNRFQMYKKVPSGWMHISSGMFASKKEAIFFFNSPVQPIREFLKTYYVGGLFKPRFCKHKINE